MAAIGEFARPAGVRAVRVGIALPPTAGAVNWGPMRALFGPLPAPARQ
jgi:hypothetical protein